MATEEKIKDVCTKGNKDDDGKTFISKTEFDVIDCSFEISCKYKDDVKPKKEKITLTCENGLPVHYGKAKKQTECSTT